MATCDRCGTEVGMPYQCRLCGGTFCSEHRLPENHACPGLEEWNDPSGVFQGEQAEASSSGRTTTGQRRMSVDTGPGGVLSYFRGNVTYLFLGLMWVTFLAQYGLAPLLGIPVNTMAWANLFTVNSANPLYVWTWLVSIFAHGGFTHIVFNSIALYFFGPVVERRVGSSTFALLFLVAGAAAGLAQVGVSLLLGMPGLTAVLGASGAIMAIMGVLTVLNPGLRVYLYFVIPMPLWLLTLGFAAYTVFVATTNLGTGGGGVAHFAHLSGLAIGLLYGLYLKEQGERAPQQLQFGGGGDGPGRGGF
ncbi:rhomboid family intramembrane serine protease [Halospeciosus flavus]|uniref:Rhomboid family intramembrane serine protease n=1 Tax=Halospeciosus flavus TaxID=3032283 RepID=A0ABD5Z5A7_9EURY|nr:rhomboid family intramembrane serine protease [Halospeciosus flavus]